MISDRSIRDLIQQARRAADEAADEAAVAKAELADLEESFRARLTAARQKVAVAEAVAEERRKAAAMFETLNASESIKPAPGRRGGRSGGPVISPEWRATLGKLPVRPVAGFAVRTIYRMEGVEGDIRAEKNIRSQLHLYKTKNIVELVEGGWRLVKPLQEERGEDNGGSAGLGDAGVDGAPLFEPEPAAAGAAA